MRIVSVYTLYLWVCGKREWRRVQIKDWEVQVMAKACLQELCLVLQHICRLCDTKGLQEHGCCWDWVFVRIKYDQRRAAALNSPQRSTFAQQYLAIFFTMYLFPLRAHEQSECRIYKSSNKHVILINSVTQIRMVLGKKCIEHLPQAIDSVPFANSGVPKSTEKFHRCGRRRDG